VPHSHDISTESSIPKPTILQLKTTLFNNHTDPNNSIQREKIFLLRDGKPSVSHRNLLTQSTISYTKQLDIIQPTLFKTYQYLDYSRKPTSHLSSTATLIEHKLIHWSLHHRLPTPKPTPNTNRHINIHQRVTPNTNESKPSIPDKSTSTRYQHLHRISTTTSNNDDVNLHSNLQSPDTTLTEHK